MIRFGRFQVDLKTGELFCGGVRVGLQQQSFQILVALLERGGEVVTRQDLKSKLWTSDTFVDFDNGLNIAVKKLRLALNDNADSPRYVDTVPRQGYRFIAHFEHDAPEKSIREVPSPPESSTPSPSPLSPQLTIEPRSTRSAMFSIAAGFMITTILCLAWILAEMHRRPIHSATRTVINSIAVLPLHNLSGDPSQEYFADAITEQIINNLAKDDSLRVISRTSMMYYKGLNKRLPEIARELNVDAVLEGAVMQSDSHIRVTAQLIRVNEDKHVWAASYERDVLNMLEVQNDLAGNIARQVQIALKSR
jgi:TolB-like protein/DNA-binding winged helix-turn-helix (wHTH) protein